MSSQDKFSVVALRIVEHQKQLIGPLAVDLAKKAGGIEFTSEKELVIYGDPRKVLGNLVNQYKNVFGDLSVQVSRRAVKTLTLDFASGELPEVLN